MTHPQPHEASDPPADRTERSRAAWVLLCCLLLIAAMAVPFWTGRIYVRDDLGAFHLPVRAFYADCLDRGDRFDWMPQLFCGFYLTGEGQAGTYHPAHFALYRLLPLRAAFCLELLLIYPFMLAGGYLFLRRHLPGSCAALWGAMAFTFGGFNLLHFIHPNAVAVVAHIPWLLWAADVAWRTDDPRKRTAAWLAVALLTGSQLLLGYPQYVWLSLVAEAAYVLVLYKSRGANLAVPLRFAAAKALGLLIGAVQLLPTADALAASARHGADASFSSWGSLHPWNLVQLAAPYLFEHRVAGQNTHELGLYAGAVPLMLVVCWAFAAKRRNPKPLAWWGLGLAGVALLMALGQYAFLHPLLSRLPLVGAFRFPCRAIVLVQLALAALAAAALSQIIVQRKSFATTRAAAAMGTVVGVSVLLVLAGPALWGEQNIAQPALTWAGPALLAAAACLVTSALRGKPWALWALAAMTAADLGFYGMSYSVYARAQRPEEYVRRPSTPAAPPAGRLAADLPDFNDRTARLGNAMILQGWSRAGGYAGLEPARRLDYSQTEALRLARVSWIRGELSPGEVPGDAAGDEKRQSWRPVPLLMPRAWLVSEAVASDNPAADVTKIGIERVALVDEPLALPGGEPGTARVLTERPGWIELSVDCTASRLLVVSESFHRGWTAHVGGRERPVLRVNGDFLGCLVGPGETTVVLQFAPASLRWGKLVSTVGVGLAVLWLIGGLLPRRGGKRQPAPRE